MEDIKKEMHEPCLFKHGFYRDDQNQQFNPGGIWTCYTLLPQKGKGHYWLYVYDNLFSISVLDLVFYEDFFMEYAQPNYISISYYDSVSGEELKPYKRLSCSYIKGHIGRNNVYQALYHKNIPIRCTSLEIMPEYYEDYLKTKYPGEYEDPREAFLSVNGSTDFHGLVFLLRQIKNYRSTGISARLYYEGKVAEAISLIIQKTKETQSTYKAKRVSRQDLDSLAVVTAYIDDHFARVIRLDLLAKIACMGITKLKYTFKEVYKTTISDYILNKRMNQAEHLVTNTDLNINQISQIVGYKKPGSFSETFRKNTGVLPNEYRKFSRPL